MILSELLRNNKYINLIPDYLKTNEDFLVFFILLTKQFDINFENIRKFTDLTNPDKVPQKFIEALGAFSNYKYHDRATVEFNREALMRMQTIWKMRGTEKSIIMAGTHGDNDGYIGGDLFIPKYDIMEDMAQLTYPISMVFRHSKSKFSGLDVFASTEYRQGILILKVPNLNDKVRKKVYEVTPAGIKYIFEIQSSFYPNIDIDPSLVGEYNELSFYKTFRPYPKLKKEKEKYDADTDIDITCTVNMIVKNDFYDILVHSGTLERYGRKLHSGVVTAQIEYGLNEEMAVSFRSYKDLKDKFTINNELKDDRFYSIADTGEYVDTKDKKGIDSINREITNNEEIYDEVKYRRAITFSANGTNNKGKDGRFSSYAVYDSWNECNIRIFNPYKPIRPYDRLYCVNVVANKTMNDYLTENDNDTSIEVEDLGKDFSCRDSDVIKKYEIVKMNTSKDRHSKQTAYLNMLNSYI